MESPSWVQLTCEWKAAQDAGKEGGACAVDGLIDGLDGWKRKVKRVCVCEGWG